MGWELHSRWSGPSQRVVFANDTLLKNAAQSKHAGAAGERRTSVANSVRNWQGCQQHYFKWCDCTSPNLFFLPLRLINSLWHFFGVASEHRDSLTAKRSRVWENVFLVGTMAGLDFFSVNVSTTVSGSEIHVQVKVQSVVSSPLRTWIGV